MDTGYFLSSVLPGIFKSKPDNPFGAENRYRLNAYTTVRPDLAFRYSFNEIYKFQCFGVFFFKFYTCIEVLCIFPYYYQVYIAILTFYSHITLTGSHTCIEVKQFSQSYIYTSKTGADRSSDRSLDPNTVLLKRIYYVLGHYCALFLIYIRSGIYLVPFYIYTGSFDYFYSCFSYLWSDPVSGYQSDPVFHLSTFQKLYFLIY